MSKGNSGGFSGTNGEKAALIQELETNGIKFSKENMVFITKDKTGQTVWLEEGNNSAGLKHIVEGNGITKGHAEDFQKAFGITKSQIPSYLEKVVTQGTVVSNTLKPIGNRMGYERVYYYEGNYHVVTGIGNNGFIVSAYPKHMK